MRKIHRSLIAILLFVFTAWGCAQRDEQKMLEEPSPESVTLEVSLGGSSRAERFPRNIRPDRTPGSGHHKELRQQAGRLR